MDTTGFNITDLMIKPHAKGPKQVKIRMAGPKPVKEHPLYEERKDEENKPSKDEDEDEEKPEKKPKNTYLVDMRNIRQLDRNIVLERLRKHLVAPIDEKSRKTIIPESKPTEEEPTNKTHKIHAKKIPQERITIDIQEKEEEETKETKEKAEALEESTEALEARVKAPPKPRAKKQYERLIFEGDADTVVIGKETIGERIPKPNKQIIRASSYYMNNRRQFQQKLADLFKPHKTALMQPDENVSCDFRKEGTKLELLTHQLIVRDYLNLYSPYRGLLIYHGLGSGKTCTSIAIAEGMKSDRPIYVLTPASLSTNYMSELKKCGDPIYKRNQFWEFINTRDNPSYAAPLAKIMGLTGEFIRSQGGVWLVNAKKKANFDSLSAEEQIQVDKQIDAMIQSKYRNVNYNANNMMTKLVHYAGGDDINPFDNSVVIVDEAHNLVSRIVNKLKQPKSVSYKIYEYLMSATNAKIVFLSGTPIINYPNEIAIMFNMLRGYIKTWTFNVNVKTSEKINKDEILKWFARDKFRLFDYVEYSGNKLSITRNPYGFVNVRKSGGTTEGNEDDAYGGVTLGEDGKMSDNDFEKTVRRILTKHGLEISDNSISVANHTALPADKDAFINMFIDPDTGILKNVDLLQRRILGLTSYFKSAQEKLLPKYDKNTDFSIVTAEMSDYQFGVYAEARKEERDRDKKNRKKKNANAAAGAIAEALNDMASTYRVFSRAFCNFAFPDPPGRPMAKNMKKLEGKNPGNEETEESESEEPTENSMDGVKVDDDTQEETKDKSLGDTYDTQIKTALKYLQDHSGEYLERDHLHIYSNKLVKLLDNLTDPDNSGLHLIYSQFRTIEGIGIIKLILEANGYAEFKLEKADGLWRIKDAQEGFEGRPRFVLYTGTESKEEKEMARNIYNSNWGAVPPNLRDQLKEIANNNYMGEIIKVFMITASGAEGINLENTRFVHIVEPYWHPVRTEQVVGRARRICSHSNLPEELRTVRVFLYLSVLSQEQKTSKKNIELRTNDVSRTNKNRPVTTDEYLYELSNTKDEISRQILKAVKETAMDCSLHKSKHGAKDSEKLVCYTFGKVTSNEFSTVPVLEMDATQQAALNIKTDVIKGTAVEIYGVKYIRKTGTQELYNAETKEYVGRLVIENGMAKIVV